MLFPNLLTFNLLHVLKDSTHLQPKLPVCVIGAGPSGISIGRLLHSHNFNYRIFEGESRVGGKAYTWRDRNGNGVEMGSFFFTKREPYINKAVQDAKLNLKWFNGSTVEIYNQSGNSVKLPIATAEQKAKFVDAVNRYTKLRDSYKLMVGYVNVPAAAQVSLRQWLQNNNLEVLVALFIPYVTVQGYGSLDEIPAIYIINRFDLKGLTSLQDFANALYTVEAGQDKLWGNLSKELNLSLNHKVVSIVRTKTYNGEQQIKLHFENWFLAPVKCSYLVMAFPPNSKKVNSMVQDLNRNEHELISKIRNNYYATTVIENKGKGWQSNALLNVLNQQNMFPVEPVGNGETVAFLNQTKYFSSYSWLKGTYQGPPPQQILNKFEAELSKLLNKLDSVRNSKTKPIFMKSFEYFPHVAVDDVKQGFFKKFDALQGYKNTFYTTTALSFETMNEAIELANSIFFNKLLPKLKH